MSYPTVVEVKKLQEAGAMTVHAIPDFADVQTHDVLYGIFCVNGTPSVTSTGDGIVTYAKWTNSSGSNQSLCWVTCIAPDAGPGDSFEITTGKARIVAGVAIQVRGAGSQPQAGSQNKAEMRPGVANNPGMQVYPGGSGLAANDRIPNRTTDAQAGVDSLLIAAFGRVGNNTWNTGINDPIGSGASDGVPYVALREKDMNWVGGSPTPDGAATSKMTLGDHAESDDGTASAQVGLAYAQVASADWAGHAQWSPYIFGGTVGVTYWPINSNGATAVPTFSSGLRVRGA